MKQQREEQEHQAKLEQQKIKEILLSIQQANQSGLASREAALSRLRAAQGALGNSRLLRYLQWRYPHETLYQRSDQQYPICVFAAPPQQWDALESVLRRPLSKQYVPTDFAVSDASFRDLIATANRPAWNGDTFVMQSLTLDEQSRISMQCALGHYYDMIDTCDALEWEILSQHAYLTDIDEPSLAQFDQLLPLRRQLHSTISDPIRDGQRRSVAASLSCTIVYRDQGQLKILIRKRSKQVAVHPGLIHVVPSFMFQPMSASFDEEYSIKHNIYREYREELFSRPDPKGGVVDWRYFYNDPLITELESYLSRGEARFFFTGVSVNLFSFRPEIHTTLLLNNDSWQRKHIYAKRGRIAFCEEFDQDNVRRAELLTSNDSDEVPRVEPVAFIADETDAQLLTRLDNVVTAKNLVPCAAAAFWLTVDLLRQLDKDRRLETLSPTQPRR